VVVVSIDDMEGIEKINQNISKTLKISLLLWLFLLVIDVFRSTANKVITHIAF
jgi:hypothetical protein